MPSIVKLTSVYVGEDIRIHFGPVEGSDDYDMSDWLPEFTLGTTDGTSNVAVKNEANSGIVIDDAEAEYPDFNGYISFPRAEALTLTRGRVYHFEFRRTKTGDNKVLSKGTMVVG